MTPDPNLNPNPNPTPIPPTPPNPYYGSNLYDRRTELPNATATLVLGILSIIFCFCYGIPGLLFGIIALAISSGNKNMYLQNPELYTGYQNLKAGRICAIVGICLSSIPVLIIIFSVIAALAGSSTNHRSLYPGF